MCWFSTKVRSLKRAESEKLRKADKAAKDEARREKEARSYGTIFQVIFALTAVCDATKCKGPVA